MRFTEYLSEAKLQDDEKQFLRILNKLYRESLKKEIDKWGKESARALALSGISSLDIFSEMRIWKGNVQLRILNNLEKNKKIVTERKGFTYDKKLKYNYGRDIKHVQKQEVNILVRPRLKEDG